MISLRQMVFLPIMYRVLKPNPRHRRRAGRTLPTIGRLIAVLAVAVTITAGTPAVADPHAPKPAAAAPQAPQSTPHAASPFVTRNGSKLMLSGKPYRYVGVNYYYAADRGNMPQGGYDAGYNNGLMNHDLTELDQSLGGVDKVLRVWFFQRQATLNGKRNWAAFDHTLSVAAAHGYKVIATLEDQYDYTEGPFKDLSFYQSGYKTDRWPTSTTDYLDYVKQVVSRYRKNPTILAWQLVNEGYAAADVTGTCPNENTAYHALYNFVQTTTTAIHKIDSNHLISDGLLYNNCGVSAGTNHYAQIANLRYNDFYELHDYSAAPVSRDAAYIFTAAAAAHRPAMIGEAGLPVSGGLAQRAIDFNAKFAAWTSYPAVAGITPWVFNGEPQLVEVDKIFDLGPGDPSLTALANYGTKS